jgi:hypothetical protein
MISEILSADPDSFVSRYTDIAAINLVCAAGLPGSADIDFPEYLGFLDAMAQAARVRTEKNRRLFNLKPAEFNHSENVFKVLTMEHVLRMQFGVKYDPLVRESATAAAAASAGGPRRPRLSDSGEVFIHGVLGPKRTGTCSSLPTFSIAVGRRLGYPLKLVRVPNHTFFRWDDDREKFNVQHTASGSDLRSDEYYYEWPEKWDAEMFALNARCKVWLHSMTPRQEVSKFLCNRALMLRDIGRGDEVIACLDAAARFDAMNPACGEIRLDIERKPARLFLASAAISNEKGT